MDDIVLIGHENMVLPVKNINIYKSSGLPDISSRLLKDGLLLLIDPGF